MNWWYGLWYRCGSIRISFAQVARAGKNPVFFLPTVYILVKNLYFFAHTLFTSSNFCPVLYFGKIRELYFCLYSVNFLNYCIKLQTIFIIWLWSFFSRRGGLLTWIYPVVLYYIYTVYSQLTSGLQSIHVPFTDEFVSIQNSTNQKKPLNRCLKTINFKQRFYRMRTRIYYIRGLYLDFSSHSCMNVFRIYQKCNINPCSLLLGF